jgi:cell division protein FtsL
MNAYRYLLSKRVANERLVREVDRRRHRELLMVAVTALVLAAAVLAYGWQHFEMIRLGYRMEELRMERERLVKVHRQLQLERAALASPDRIEAIAAGRLGMVEPSADQFVVIEPRTEGTVRWDDATAEASREISRQE